MNDTTEKYSIELLKECAKLQKKKGQDYQSSHSKIRQADHYPNGCMTILDMSYQKIIRLYSLLEKEYATDSVDPNYESVIDSVKDAINYLSFLAEYYTYNMDGQRIDRDVFNRILPIEEVNTEYKGYRK